MNDDIKYHQGIARGHNMAGTRIDGGGDNRPPVYEDNGQWIYRASGVGKLCERSLWLARTGHQPSPTPKTLQTAFVHSANGEDTVCAMAEKEYELQIVDRQKVIDLPVTNLARVRGSIDGTADGRLIEIKCIRSEDWAKRGQGIDMYPGWREQVNLYMRGLDMREGILLMGRKDSDGVVDAISYTNFVYEPRIYAKIRNKIFAVETAALDGDPIDCAEEQWGCPYWQLHEGTRVEVEEISDPQANNLTTQIMKLQNQKKNVERQIADLKKQVDIWRDNHNIGAAVIIAGKGGRYKVTRIEPTKKVWDETKLDKDGINIDDYRMTIPGSPYLLITEDKDN